MGFCPFPGQPPEGPCAWVCIGAGRGPSDSVSGLETTAELLGVLAGRDRAQVRPEAFCAPRAPSESDQPYCVCCTVWLPHSRWEKGVKKLWVWKNFLEMAEREI